MKTAIEILKDGTFIPAVPLALDVNRKFDEYVQRRLIRYYLEAGVGGIAAGVHTTQFEIRSPQYNLFNTVLSVIIGETLSIGWELLSIFPRNELKRIRQAYYEKYSVKQSL